MTSPLPQPTLRGERVVLRPLEVADLDWVRASLAGPSVAAWWDQGTGDGWVDELLDDDEIAVHVVEEAGSPVGFVQWGEEADPGYRHAFIDIFMTEAGQGRGLGAEVVHTLARWLIDERGHHRIEIDPAAANERAIRCYASVGFKPVGLARHRERDADGTWHDSLLMDLLAEELHPPPTLSR